MPQIKGIGGNEREWTARGSPDETGRAGSGLESGLDSVPETMSGSAKSLIETTGPDAHELSRRPMSQSVNSLSAQPPGDREPLARGLCENGHQRASKPRNDALTAE